MLHKFEKMLGLPEDSLVYEKEVRSEKMFYKNKQAQKTKEKKDERLAKGEK